MEPEVRHKPVRYYEIDLLRFLAALAVVLYHYTYRGYAADNYSPIPFLELGRFTKYGHLGVELFFIVSGYVVLLSVQGKTLRQFFLSRITRLYPAFWAACTLTFLVKCIWGTTAADAAMSPLLQAGVKQYVYNMTMLHEFFGIGAIDGAYWSLTIEITFYFLIGLLISFKLMRHVDGCLALWLAYAALPSAVQNGTPFGLLFFPSGAPYFAAGMLFYLIQQPQGRTWLRYALLFASYLLAIRAVIGKTNALAARYHDVASHAVVVGIVTLFFGIFLLIVFRKINLGRFKWLSWLGALTYPLYLVHSDIGFIAFHRLGGTLNKYFLLGILLLTMLLLAYLMHVFVERQFSKLLGIEVNKWLVRMDQTQ
jgi:peptidoglycan/LPS O-acetylase OafA/YrhL